MTECRGRVLPRRTPSKVRKRFANLTGDLLGEGGLERLGSSKWRWAGKGKKLLEKRFKGGSSSLAWLGSGWPEEGRPTNLRRSRVENEGRDQLLKVKGATKCNRKLSDRGGRTPHCEKRSRHCQLGGVKKKSGRVLYHGKKAGRRCGRPKLKGETSGQSAIEEMSPGGLGGKKRKTWWGRLLTCSPKSAEGVGTARGLEGRRTTRSGQKRK